MSYLDSLNLSPATLAGLAQIRGTPQASIPSDDPDSPEAWQQAATAAGAPNGVQSIGPGETYGDVQQRASGGDMTKYASPNLQVASGVGSGPSGSPLAAPPSNEEEPDAAPEPTRDQVVQGMAAPPAATTIPARWQPGTHTVQMQHGMNPDELEQAEYNRDVSMGHGMLEGDKKLQAAREAGLADAVYAGAHALIAKQTTDRMAAIQARRDQYVVDQKQKLEDLASKAQQTEDPKAFWKDQGTFGSVLTGIMIGLGQFASMASGRGENAALKIVNDNIDRNIASQRTNIANAHKAYDTASNLYEKNLAEFGDQERAVLATKVQYLDQAVAMADAQRVKAGITDAEAMNHGFIKSLYGQRAQAAEDFAKLTHTQVNEAGTETYHPAQTIGGAGSTKREGNLVTTADGTTYHFGSPELAKKAVEKLQAYGEVQLLTNKILAARKETMRLDPIVDKTKYDANILYLKKLDDDLAQADSTANGQGVVTEQDTKRRQAIGLDATAGLGTFKGGHRMVSSDYDAANHAYTQSLKTNTDRQRGFVQAAGGEAYQRDYMKDATGNYVPTGRYVGKDAKPAQRIAPHGSKPMSPRDEIAADDAPDNETLPRAPVRSGVFQPASGGGGGKKKKGDSAKLPKSKRR